MNAPADPANAPADQHAKPRPGSSGAVLKRLTAITAVLFLLVLADALYMQFSDYQAGTYNNFHLNDAATVFIAAAFLAVITVALAVLSRRADRNGR